MDQQDPVTIIGPPLDAWLTAVMLARFAPLAGTPLQVLETPSATGENEIVTLRPEMVRTHVSIGLDPKRIGAAPIQAWTGPRGQSLPFNSFGQPLKGVSFIAIWLRAREELGDTRPLESFAAARPSGAYAIEVGRYVQALKAIAMKVGVKLCANASERSILADPNYTVAEPVRIVGAAAITLRPSATLRLQAVHHSVLTLIDCWSWRETDRELADAEYDRRLEAMRAPIQDMQTVLCDEAQLKDYSSDLQHRIAVWRDIGRVAPVDNDPFGSQEWMSAFLHAGVAPTNAGRLAQSLTQAEIADHLQACSPKEVANVQ